MADLEKLIENILSNSKFAPGGASAEKVYRDEPILLTASQMERLTPPQYRAMRKIAEGPAARLKSEAAIFYEQGRFMEDFEDDFEYQGDFTRYFPTYQSMNDRELRGYFSWRAKIRRGVIEKTRLSFAFVYIYELLNQIGVESPEAGFFALKNFRLAYRELDYQIDRYVEVWLRDYVVYNNLDKSLLEEFSEANFDRAILTLMDYKAQSAEDMFAALNSLSSYNLENSRFFKQRPEEFKEVLADVFAQLAAHYDKNRAKSLFESFFGKMYGHSYAMFSSAVFCRRDLSRDRVYEINPIYRFVCANGLWRCERFFGRKANNQQVGELLKTVDFLMRRKYNFKSALKPGQVTKILETMIDRAIDQARNRRREAARAEISIDFSKLSAIRAAALKTQGKLIVEETPEEGTAEVMAVPEAPAAAEAAGPENGAGLSGAELEFLELITLGRDCGEFLRARGLTPALVIDSINEKLFDRFGDTVIVESGGRPEVLEDYLEQVRKISRGEQ